MRTDKKENDGADATHAAQTAQAGLCRTTVISGIDAYDDRTGRLVALVRKLGHRGRFDLLTVPRPELLADDRQLLGQVARDAALAIKLHHGEQIVVAIYGDPAPVVRALKERAEFRDGGVEISGLDLRERDRSDPPPPAATFAVACMDFRQHDSDLPRRFREVFGLSETPAVLAMAGGAKELVDSLPRGRRVIQRLRKRALSVPIERVVLSCHTDCGAMGGDAAPAFLGPGGRPDARRQIKVLQEHLRASALSVRLAFPDAEILTGIVRLKDGRIDDILKAHC